MKIKRIIPIIILMISLGCCYYYKEQLTGLFYVYQEEERPQKNVRLAYWQKQNKDVYAWIRIKDTNINYPIVQNEEDGYYLTHDYEKEKNRYGAIYSEKINAKDFNNEKTVLYGHDMADQSMFGGLKKFLNPKYRREHPYIEIDTPKEKRIYRIEAAYLCSDRHLLKNEEENREHERGGECERGSEHGKTAVKEPQLILSTCAGKNSRRRCLVQAVLKKRVKREKE